MSQGMPRKDLTDLRSGRLVAIRRINDVGDSRWLCRCDCGKDHVAGANTLLRGTTKSCGCMKKEAAVAWGKARRKHGMTRSSEYYSWCSMLARCSNPNSNEYFRYGATGVTVCPEWRESFLKFYADMGPKPTPEYSIDRKDNDKGYSPDNCCWATAKEQAINRRRTVWLEFNGERKLLAEWSKVIGVATNTLRCRYKLGWTVKDILTMPLNEVKGGRRKKPPTTASSISGT